MELTKLVRKAIAQADSENEAVVVPDAKYEPPYPRGFFKTLGDNNRQGWGHFCGKCAVVTFSDAPLKAGQILRVRHCGKVEEFQVSAWRFVTMPKVPRGGTRFPKNVVPVGVLAAGSELDFATDDPGTF